MADMVEAGGPWGDAMKEQQHEAPAPQVLRPSERPFQTRRVIPHKRDGGSLEKGAIQGSREEQVGARTVRSNWHTDRLARVKKR